MAASRQRKLGMPPSFDLEYAYAPQRVCGVDEAGRGPWAGPVVAAAVIFPDVLTIPNGINDSKKLSKQKRSALAAEIQQRAMVGIGMASVEEIDTLNILRATMLAMQRAVEALPEMPEAALVDGNRAPPLAIPVQCVVKGDATSLSIAAASIIAKVTRDTLMEELARAHPHYGFEQHAGYGTPTHQQALAQFGPCPAHRRSFAPIRALLAA